MQAVYLKGDTSPSVLCQKIRLLYKCESVSGLYFFPLFHLSTFGQILTIKTFIYQMTTKNMKRQTTK